MNSTEILFEPLPIGRIGVRTDNEEVVIAQDYSCFAKMLEEYIAHGAVSIVIPASAPESKTIAEMPLLLRKRIRLVNDDREEEAVERLFYGLRADLGITVSKEARNWRFPKSMPTELRRAVSAVLDNTRRMMFAYNNQVQAEVNVETAIEMFRYVRDRIADTTTKLIIAHLEGLLTHYDRAEFDAFVPRSSSGRDLINAFDQLVNDSDYVRYSEAVADLAVPSSRGSAISRLRELSRSLSAKKFVGVSWDYMAKLIAVGTGIPIPESKELTVFTNEKPLPSLINMQPARERAVQQWKNSPEAHNPLTRKGRSVSNEKVQWLPPMPSMEVYSPDAPSASLGTVSELLDALNKAREIMRPKD